MTVKRVYVSRKTTPQNLKNLRAIREQFQKEKPSLEEALAASGASAPVPLGEYVLLQSILMALKKQRVVLKMSLADLSKRSGIDVATLSKLESGKMNNPTLGTINRVSGALGKRVRCVIEDESAVTV
jgi:DNA-binding Xre family transcriptional regulator